MIHTLEICGINDHSGITEMSNNTKDNYVYPSIQFGFDVSILSSYSFSENKTVAVTNEGIVYGIGDNTQGQINGSLPKEIIQNFTQLELRDKNDQACPTKSAVCGYSYTAYMIFSSSDDSKNQIAIAHSKLDITFPVILNIGDVNPIYLYGGCYDCAAIDSEGAILFIHRTFYKKYTEKIEPVFLPEGEKAVSVACCSDYVFVLSLNGRVFASEVESDLSFKQVLELNEENICFISGIHRHCFAVSKECRVFVYGNNSFGRLGVGKDIENVTKFTEISSLNTYKINAAFAGVFHSLFLTSEGKLFACGRNNCGQLLLSSGPCDDFVDVPVETIITNASFCIAGYDTTAVFKNYEPPLIPNKRISLEKSYELAIASLKSEIESLKTQIINEKKEKEKEINELKKQNEIEIDKLKKQHETEINKLEKKKETEINELKEQKENEVGELIRQYEIEISQLTKQHEIDISEIKKENEIDTSEVKKPRCNEKIEILDDQAMESYERIEEIRSGSSGRIYKVAKKVIYALKEMKAGISSRQFQQFLQEYELLCYLDHPNIVKTFGIFLSSQKHPPSILLEFCPMNLEEAIKMKKLNDIDLVLSIVQIVEGMKYVHFRKIIHRDLKPTNILIASDGTVKISDFGVSKLISLEEQQTMTEGVGTQKFMAPEIIDESDNYDEKVDVYSFGVVLFFVLSGGELPKIKMSEKMKGKKAEIPSSFTDFSRRLITKCWSFNAKDRPSFEEISHELQNNASKLIKLENSQIKDAELKIKQHKVKIPSY